MTTTAERTDRVPGSAPATEHLWMHFTRMSAYADKPAPITDKEAEAILRRVADGSDKPKPKTLLEPGEVVRVTDGPFADFNGTVEEVNYEKSRIQVAVLIFGRSTPVELEFSQVEKV